jgi:hypothetical protein
MIRKVLHPLTNIRIAIDAIRNDTYLPVTRLVDTYYVFNLDKVFMGNIIYTEFNSEREPIKSYAVRYGAHHNLVQVIKNQLPRSELDYIANTHLPEEIDAVIEIGKIIKVYE